MKANNNKSSRDATQELDRRMAPRVIEIVERLAPEHEQIAACAPAVIPPAKVYMRLFDQAVSSVAERRRAIAVRDEGSAELHRETRSWVAVLRRDVPGIADEFDARPEVASDVIVDAERLMEMVRSRAGSKRPLPYGERILASLGPRVEAVDAAATEAHRARVEAQWHQAQVREAAKTFRRELVGLRRVLRVVLGSSSLDYQRLRLGRYSTADGTEAIEIDVSDAIDEPSGEHEIPTISEVGVRPVVNQ